MDKALHLARNVGHDAVQALVVSETLRETGDDLRVLSAGLLETALPIAQPLGALLVASRMTAHSLPLLDTRDDTLKLGHDLFARVHGRGKARLVRTELFELGSKQLRLDVLRPAVQQEQVGNIVVLNLVVSSIPLYAS